MNPQTNPQSKIEFTEQQKRTSQLKLIGIFAVALIPVALAIGMYFGGLGLPDQKTNKGDLLWPPVQIGELGTSAGSAESVIADSPNWYLMLTHQDSCVEACAEQLHMMRQVNIALGREMERVSRLVVAPSEVLMEKTFAEKYQNLNFVSVEQSDIEKLTTIAEQKLSDSHETLADSWNIWLVDPLGNIIMRYGPGHDGYDIKADLKKLLKLSNIG